MTSGEYSCEGHRPYRREVVTGIGVGLTGLAGCGSNRDAELANESPEGRDEDSGGAGLATASSDAAQQGGIPIIGLAKSPESLNPLAGSHQLLTRMLFTFGTEIHPTTGKPVPWAFRDWTLNVENIGTSSPTLIGKLREDMTFSDGTRITAQDAKFTVEYIKEQDAVGSYAASQFDSIESVEVDAPRGRTVSYFFAEPDAGWFSRILGQILLPRHIWRDVANYQQYSPLTEPEGVVGSGAFEVESVNIENWFELKTRPDEGVWQTSATYADWFHEEAPFVDGIRIRIFGAQRPLRQAVKAGDVDAAFAPVGIDQAVRAKDHESLEVRSTETAGWHHHSYNTRRVPLDDRAFRQLLVKLVDKRWIVEELDRGVGSTEGTYAIPRTNPDWRPPEPTNQSTYQGIPTPTLEFPGKSGTFQLSADAMEAARSFLSEHPKRVHDYSWQPPENEDETADSVLHVNGTSFRTAHTDNAGKLEQGPLMVSFNPPEDDLDEARIAQKWIEVLRSLGIPAEARVESLSSQVSQVFVNEDFDVVSMNWTDLTLPFTYFEQLFGRWGADIEGEATTPMANAMGYTGADDLIQAQRTTMEVPRRKRLVKELLAQIWRDAPTNVLKHDVRLQPVNRNWTGWVETTGLGVVNLQSFLNMRRSTSPT